MKHGLTRRALIGGTLATITLVGLPSFACPPAKFKVGQLVEHKETGIRLYVINKKYVNNNWEYGLGINNKVFTVELENELKAI